MQELQANGVEIYQFPTDDESVSEVNGSMNAHLPFAVVGSTDFVRVGNKTLRARQYAWGTVHVESEAHCDFVKLREMLIRTNMEDMRDKTHARHYELYRRRRLTQMGFSDVDADNKPVSAARVFCSLHIYLLLSGNIKRFPISISAVYFLHIAPRMSPDRSIRVGRQLLLPCKRSLIDHCTLSQSFAKM